MCISTLLSGLKEYGHDRNYSVIDLCFGGDSHLSYVKNKVFANFWGSKLPYQAKRFTTKPDYNLEASFPKYLLYMVYGFENLF